MIVCPTRIMSAPSDDHTPASSLRAPEPCRKVRRVLQIRYCRTFGARALLLAGPLQLPLDCGQGLRRGDKGDCAQGEAVRHKAADEVITFLPLALVLDGRGQPGRRA